MDLEHKRHEKGVVLIVILQFVSPLSDALPQPSFSITRLMVV